MAKKNEIDLDEWIGNDEGKRRFIEQNPEAVRDAVKDILDSASGAVGTIKAAMKTRDAKNILDQMDANYKSWRASAPAVEEDSKEEAKAERAILSGGYEREGMADEKDIQAYRDAILGGAVSKPTEFTYDWDSAIQRFQNPNLQAQVDRATQALERSATARGINDSSDLRKMISDRAASIASEDYQKAAQLANQDRNAAISVWEKMNTMTQDADKTRLGGLAALAGYGNENVIGLTDKDLGIQRYGFETTESAYQTDEARRIAEEEAEKNRKAAEDAANKKMITDIATGVISAVAPKA